MSDAETQFVPVTPRRGLSLLEILIAVALLAVLALTVQPQTAL